jgi:N-acetylmuramoyl-L-alanine amidase
MGYYLLDHPNDSYKQYRTSRRNGAKVSGVIDIHTTENYPDTVQADLGAENVAAWIARREDPGSYHIIVDSDSTVLMAPLEYECWHDRFTNNHSVGISMATRADDWAKLSATYRDNMVTRAARATADVIKWFKEEHGISVPVRWLSAPEAHGRTPGLVRHGTSDPTRRHDPGTGFPSSRFFVATNNFLGQWIAKKEDDYLPLLLDGKFGQYSITELQRALKRSGDYGGLIEDDYNRTADFGSVTKLAYQRLLNRKGYYRYAMDGKFERESVKAEQRWLKFLGNYKGIIDGQRGVLTIKGLQDTLNEGRVK